MKLFHKTTILFVLFVLTAASLEAQKVLILEKQGTTKTQRFYKGDEIILDPKSDVENYDWTTEYLDEIVVREIPDIMFLKTEGNIEIKEYPEDFEGLPLNYAQKVSDIFEEYDVE